MFDILQFPGKCWFRDALPPRSPVENVQGQRICTHRLSVYSFDLTYAAAHVHSEVSSSFSKSARSIFKVHNETSKAII